MNKNNKIESKNHRLFELKAEFSKLKTREEKKEYRAGLNNQDRLLLRRLNNDSSLVITKINKSKIDFETETIRIKGKNKEIEITPLSRYKKISNLIVKNIEELPTYKSSIQLNPISKKCPANCCFKTTCADFSPDIDFPIISSGIERNQISDEINFYSRIGLFRKFVFNTPQLWKSEAESEVKKAYYITREKGLSISKARQTAKLEGLEIGLKYSEVYKSIKRNYYSPQNCDCSECFAGRSYNCLNGVLKPYIPKYESLEEVSTKQDLNLILLSQFANKKNKLKAGQFIKRIYNLCRDETDARIINLTLSGKSQIEIGETVKLDESNIYRRLVKIGVKYNNQYKTK